MDKGQQLLLHRELPHSQPSVSSFVVHREEGMLGREELRGKVVHVLRDSDAVTTTTQFSQGQRCFRQQIQAEIDLRSGAWAQVFPCEAESGPEWP